MKAYQACLAATSTKHAPWYMVPADDKENAQLTISEITLDVLQGLEMTYGSNRLSACQTCLYRIAVIHCLSAGSMFPFGTPSIIHGCGVLQS